ncbi:RNA-directed DNA polymerase, eukaryota [Tanacetum coccineum]
MVDRNRSNEDHTRMISKSIFVTNFPENFTSKDLWKVCQDYGTVVDVYIPNCKSKAGKQFAFVRFIKVDNVDRLVGNLCTLWIGRMHLHANVVRFERSSKPPYRSDRPIRSEIPGAPSFTSVLKGNLNVPSPVSSTPSMVLDDSCVVVRDLDYHHVGVASWLTRICNAQSDFVSNERIFWVDIEGVPLHAWSRATFNKIGSKWGEVMELEEKDKELVYCKGVEEEQGEVNNQMNSDAKSDVDGVSETYFGEQECNPENDQNHEQPLNIPYPPGYTPEQDNQKTEAHEVKEKDPVMSLSRSEGLCSRILEDTQPIDEHLSSDDDMIKVGQTMGYTMEGCKKDIENIIGLQGVNERNVLCYITSLITRWDGESIVMGDFNEVGYVEERMGSVYNAQGANEFNDFISNSGLVDVHLERFKKKMQILKKEIRVWVMDQKRKQLGRINEIKIKLSDIDKQLDQGGVNDDILLTRMDLMQQMQEHKLSDARDNMQKAKVQWAIEGDENSKYFHGIINRKCANSSIRGIMVDGEWVDEPNHVKEEFHSHFAMRFQAPVVNPSKLNFQFPKRLNSDQVAELENPITREEIHNAVWGCGEDKSPGPDGFTFDFFRKFWNIIGPDFCVAVEWFFDHSLFTRGCNSSFVTLIPKVQDLKFVNDYQPISLIGSLYKAMVFKVDFAKAYDLIRWDYLDDVLRSFGFGSKWRSWINGSLISGMASILINGSSTSEFQFHCGLKQGDPLAPYLFILIMESLHLSFSRVVDADIFKGIKIDTSVTISHLFYADDAVFIGVGVPNDNITSAAMNLGCSVMKTPFKYLGVMVGVKNFNGKQGDEKKIAWVKWSKVLAAKKHGGLGVSSYYALNRALLFKWVWRFIYQDNSLWFRLITSIHGNGLLTRFWSDILLGDKQLWYMFPRIYALELNKECTVAKKMQNYVDHSLRRTARGGAEANQLDQLQGLIGSMVLANTMDRWY